MTGDLDRKLRAADDARFSHLPRHQRRMRGSAADGRHDSRRDGKAADVGGRGVGSHENDRVAACCQASRAVRIESRASYRNPG